MQDYTTREIDQRFELLTQYERRCVVDFLQEIDAEHAGLDEVVRHLQQQRQMPDERAKISVALLHIHLPKLATTDILEYDARSETVRYNGDELVESLLESTPEKPVPSL